MRDIEKTNKGLRALITFTVVFLSALICITLVAKKYTPVVDVEIGNSTDTFEELEQTIDETKIAETKKNIDERLKQIELEDNIVEETPKAENKNKISEDTPKKKSIFVKKEDKEEQNLPDIGDIPAAKFPPLPLPEVASPDFAPTPQVAKTIQFNKLDFKMNRVIVGKFNTIEEAMAAQKKLMGSDLNIQPYIKEVEGKYILQAASFANKDKAETLSDKIKSMGYSSKVISE